ncbi:NAD-glutamate dehydrogenase [Nocardia tengchongensis]|uniref:NAD-glutamate dehydrogenase n=1 Tax=Nocardia tengchongensis TaxID=2055889 RepID=UPI0036BE46EA
MATAQHTLSWKHLHDDPAALESVYFRWVTPGTSASPVTERAGRIFRRHLELATVRRPGSPSIRVYRPDDAGGLGPAIQIVNDDMPLLVDSVSSMLRRVGVTVTEIVHPVFDVLRDKSGLLRVISPGSGSLVPADGDHTVAESWIHLQLAAESAGPALDEAERRLPALLAAIRRIAADTPVMTRTMEAAAADLEVPATNAETTESAQLLRWLVDGRLTLLGYAYLREAETAAGTDDSDRSGVGAGSRVSEIDSYATTVDSAASASVELAGELGVLYPALAAGIVLPPLESDRPVLRVSNVSLESVLPGIGEGCLISVSDRHGGEHVFIGSFTVSGYHENVLDIPVISRRVAQVLEWAGSGLNSFSGQALLEMLQTYPRAELFTADARGLFESVSAVMDFGLRRQVRLSLRPDERTGAVYCLVYLPRDRYSNEVRSRMGEILRTEFDGVQLDYSARATESELAVVYFTVHRRPDAEPADVSERHRERVQELLLATTRTWSDLVIAEAAGVPDPGPELLKSYIGAFPATYRQEHGPARALADLRRLHHVPPGGIETLLYHNAGAPESEWRFALYVHGAAASLSRVLPILHSLGVEVVEERPYALTLPDGSQRWIYDFGLCVPEPPAALTDSRPGQGVRRHVEDAVTAMWFGRTEIDALNELVLRAGLRDRQISVLRAYAKYLQQAGFSYSFATVSRIMLAQPEIARAFVELFEARFDPDSAAPVAQDRAQAARARLRAGIEAMVSLDADRVLRAFQGLIEATLRTNYYVTDARGATREFLSLKFDPRQITELPKPRPRYEIFVYSPRVEGVHLRFGAVARGGLRWSDRLDDFRTEILGLVKAQAVKNAVIVPVGAKGGFVVKRPPADRAQHSAEAIACYRMFIAGLLDLTDNVDRVSGAVLPPARVRRHDGDDTYLVVAADKGTATFSDIANGVAADYGYWLGDAFASGGSVGYDHKAIAITARGAWESVKRHFAELDLDTAAQDFTVVGVGDMSGDVFGNGMLLSRHIRLVAAFDHRHIFLDPNPDAAASFAERERLFALPRSSWADYNRDLISEGGGVYDRGAKSIPITAAVRDALGLPHDRTSVSPPDLIRSILCAPVDLLWNGGIGTYVRASTETDVEVGDKSNDAVRVDASMVRARVIGEGGNLGVTPRGRVEFCRGGGKMNTDALDNSAGVDCSDHEVNIKILLDTAVAAGELPAGERDSLLAAMTGEVADSVLRDNISQNTRLGISRAHAAPMAAVHRRMLTDLEQRAGLDRELEALPTDSEMGERIAAGTGLTSAELAGLLAHVKLAIKDELLRGRLPDHSVFADVLISYFPQPLRARFGAALGRHPLRREIIATSVVNDLVDNAGISYVFRLSEEMGVSTEDAVRAYTAVAAIFDLPQLWRRIRGASMPTALRDELELETKRTLDRASRWLLSNRPQPIAIGADIARYRDAVRELSPLVPAWRPGAIATEVATRSQLAVERGAPRELAEEVYLLIFRYPLLDIIDVAELAQREAGEVLAAYYALDEHFEIQRLLAAVVGLERTDRWRTLARLAVRDDLYDSLRALTFDVLLTSSPEDTAEDKIAFWESINHARLARARGALTEIFAVGTLDMATLSVAARQVRSMAGGGESVAPSGTEV